MRSYSAIIIDDERLARLTLLKDLEKFPEINIVGEASGIFSAKSLIAQNNPDLLFLDIQLEDGDGFDLLNQINYTGKVIFITAYDEYALRAFEINAVDYLLKPVSVKRLKGAIERVLNSGDQQSEVSAHKLNYTDRLMVMHKQSVNFIKIDSIVLVTASREYTYIHTLDGREYLTSKSIGEWESRMPEEHFCRIHRSTIINFNFIGKIVHKLNGSAEVLIHGHSEPLFISRNYFRKIKERYSL